jgi:Flp pilus assembly protein TadG
MARIHAKPVISFRKSGLVRAASGATAIEFALIAPVLVFILCGSFELTQAITASRKTAVLSRTISDFVSQTARSATLSSANLSAIAQASTAVMYPFPVNGANLTVTVQSILTPVGSKGHSKIQWSYSWHPNTGSLTPYQSGQEPDITYNGIEGKSVIKCTVAYRYTPVFGKLLASLKLDQVTLSQDTLMTPRSGSNVKVEGQS